MDWALAIERNRAALMRIVAALVSLAELAGGRPTLPRHLHRAVLRLLRPTESAVRRLIVVVARGLTVPPPRRSTVKDRQTARAGTITHAMNASAATLSRSLPLLDRLPVWHRRRPSPSGVPRISVPGVTAVFPVAPRCELLPEDPIDAARLNCRLAALAAALDDLPAHARRFARWMAARDAAATQDRPQGAPGRHRRIWPLRPGRPPGQRSVSGRRRPHEIYELLEELHGLAAMALQAPDSS